MSFQLNQEKGIENKIDMPPVPPEVETEIEQISEENVQAKPIENLQQQTQVPTVDKMETVQAESAQAKNFRQLREKADKLERERDEAIKYIQSLQKPTQPQQQEQEQEEININDNDLVEGKHLAKFAQKYKKLEQQLQQYQQQTSETVIETKLKTQFPDFDKVVSRDNVELLRSAYPELAQTLNTSTDLYNKAVTAYTMIKKLNISPDYESEKQTIEKNIAKPKPLASISPQQGESPLSRANAFANGLTDDLKKQLLKEMQDARKAM